MISHKVRLRLHTLKYQWCAIYVCDGGWEGDGKIMCEGVDDKCSSGSGRRWIKVGVEEDEVQCKVKTEYFKAVLLNLL